MWKDITGKTGYKNMQGENYLYGNLKLLNTKELDAALIDGITVWVKPVRKPKTVEQMLESAKMLKINNINSLFSSEVSKPVDVDGTIFKGGYEIVDRIDGARRLAELKVGNRIFVYDIDDKPVILNPAEIKNLVIILGDTYQDLFAIKQSLTVSTREASNLQEIENIIIPWQALEL